MVNISILNAIKNSKYTNYLIYSKSKNISSDRDIANLQDFDFALDRIAMGVGRKNMFITEEDKMFTAIHESGHTITALLTPGSIPLHKVTILPRGGALGFVKKKLFYFLTFCIRLR